jgi:hypothetical protein
VTVLQGLAPTAQITLDSAGNRLLVVATPADHEVIKPNIEQVQKAAAAEETRKLVVYPVTEPQRKRFEAVLTTVTAELPGIQVITDAEPGELSVWARPSQHTVVKEILDQLKREVPTDEKYQLIAYPVKVADPTTVVTTLQTLFPGTQIVLETKSRRVLVWTRPDRHPAIKGAIEAMDLSEPGDAARLDTTRSAPSNQRGHRGNGSV